MKLLKNKKVISFATMILAVMAVWFFSTYQVFFSPFEIISKADVEKNKQGICVAEGRKLTEKELFTRTMTNYWNRYKYGMTEDASGKPVPFCGRVTECKFWQVQDDYTLTTYTRKILNTPKNIGLDETVTNYFDGRIFDPTNQSLLNKYDNARLPYSVFAYIDFGGTTLYPKDCCQVLPLSKLKGKSLEFIDTPTHAFERGRGNHVLKVRQIALSAYDESRADYLRPWIPSTTEYVIGNCGEFNLSMQTKNYESLKIIFPSNDYYSDIEKYRNFSEKPVYWKEDQFVDYEAFKAYLKKGEK